MPRIAVNIKYYGWHIHAHALLVCLLLSLLRILLFVNQCAILIYRIDNKILFKINEAIKPKSQLKCQNVKQKIMLMLLKMISY